MEQLLTNKQVAEKLGMSVSNLYAKMKRGEFPRPLRFGVKMRRWKESTVDEWVDALPKSDPAEWHNLKN